MFNASSIYFSIDHISILGDFAILARLSIGF